MSVTNACKEYRWIWFELRMGEVVGGVLRRTISREGKMRSAILSDQETAVVQAPRGIISPFFGSDQTHSSADQASCAILR